MSGDGNDRPGKVPEDPWARWRKPGEPTAVDAGTPAEASAPDDADATARRTLGVKPLPAKAPPADVSRKARPPRPQGEASRRADGAPRKPDARPLKPRPGPAAGGTVRPAPARTDIARTASRPPAESPAQPIRKMPPATSTAPVAAQAHPAGIRLSKVMSERGLCSRREADLWIERGWVFVDGVQISELGSRIDPAAEITITTEAKKDQAKQVTILLHKPVGYVSGQPEPGCTPAVTLITAETQVMQPGDAAFKPWMLRGLAPAGRLDVDSTGLLVLTQDGRVAKKLVGDDGETEKEYLVRVSGQLIEDGLKLLNHGLELDGKPLRPARVKQLNEDQLHFILKEGRKRQIRRMCERVGLCVIGLKRVRIGRIRLGDLPPGKWRFLRADEAF